MNWSLCTCFIFPLYLVALPFSLGQDVSPKLLKKFEVYLDDGDYSKLRSVIREFRLVEGADEIADLDFLQGLCEFNLGNFNESFGYFKKYSASGNSTYQVQNNQFLETLSRRNNKRGHTNSIGVEMVYVPSGTYMMGSRLPYKQIQNDFNEYTPSDPNMFADEHPLHLVEITRNLFVGKYEVTVGQFRKFVEAKNYVTDAEKNGGAYSGVDPNLGGKTISGGWVQRTWRTGKDNEPVSFVSWNDANQFLIWLNKKERAKYRLPTEAEWEYFARGGTETLFFSGNSVESLASFANVPDLTFKNEWPKPITYQVVPSFDGHAGKAPVGSFKPNNFGLYDIHGNVFEWCFDGYSIGAYANHGTRNPYIKTDTEYRVIRGGCFM